MYVLYINQSVVFSAVCTKSCADKHSLRMASLSLEQLHLYHSLDRGVFFRLVNRLRRDVGESLLAMALWFWLEEKGYPNIIVKMVDLSDPALSGLALEAELCLKCLQSNSLHQMPFPPTLSPFPLTSKAMDLDFSLQIFIQNRFSAISGVKFFLKNVCSRVFDDIVRRVLGAGSANELVVIRGFPHPVFGGMGGEDVDRNVFPADGLWSWNSERGTSEDDRTLFLTFSRGFPVSKEEVKEVFGECVEGVEMEGMATNGLQPLYARMVLNSVGAVDRILNCRRISKFRINGKHIWARKYERRD